MARHVPKGVLCLISALSSNELTTQVPHRIDVALERGKTKPRLDDPPTRFFWFSGPAFHEGIETHEIDGVPVRIYDPEKTLVERPFQEPARATKDVDLLARTSNSLENLERAVREVCSADLEPDGMVFDPATVLTQRIKEHADYEGVRARFVGLLGRAHITMQLDVGFGDVVTPGAVDITYPALLDFRAPELSGYPRETVIAESSKRRSTCAR